MNFSNWSNHETQTFIATITQQPSITNLLGSTLNNWEKYFKRHLYLVCLPIFFPLCFFAYFFIFYLPFKGLKGSQN
jgi:hypothetical protein